MSDQINYPAGTDPGLQRALNRLMNHGSYDRIVILYGDTLTGEAYSSGWSAMGWVSASGTAKKIPLLCPTRGSKEGEPIAIGNILKIMRSRGKALLWCHPILRKYEPITLTLEPNDREALIALLSEFLGKDTNSFDPKYPILSKILHEIE